MYKQIDPDVEINATIGRIQKNFFDPPPSIRPLIIELREIYNSLCSQ